MLVAHPRDSKVSVIQCRRNLISGKWFVDVRALSGGRVTQIVKVFPVCDVSVCDVECATTSYCDCRHRRQIFDFNLWVPKLGLRPFGPSHSLPRFCFTRTSASEHRSCTVTSLALPELVLVVLAIAALMCVVG